MKFVEIKYGSSLYKEELALRDMILRKPLNLSIYDEVSAEEKGYWHFGIVQQETLIACLIIIPLDSTSINAGQMAVTHQLQRSGVGKKLIAEVEKILISRSIQSVYLSARVSAVTFYQKLGYSVTGEPFKKINIPHVKMTKALIPDNNAT